MTTESQYADKTDNADSQQKLAGAGPELLRNMDSDLKFIDWSKSTFQDSYDVVGLANHLNQSGKTSMKGLDIGGGIGIFAGTVIDCCAIDLSMTVCDPGIKASEQRVNNPKIDFHLSTFDDFASEEKYDFIVFRLVLHHLIGQNAEDTLQVQRKALEKARSLLNEGGFLFVVENYYEPVIGADTTSKLIYWWTSQKSISALTRRLGANTAGEGVRFRSKANWESLFKSIGFESLTLDHHPWWGKGMPWWQRLPLLCKQRFQATSILSQKL